MTKCWRTLYISSMWTLQDIRSSSSLMYCYIVALKNVPKFTGIHLHRIFSTCNLQLHRKRERRRQIWFSVSFAKFFRNTFIMENLLKIGFERRTYEKWRTDVLIIIKRYREVDSSFMKQSLRGKVYIGEPLIESWHWT